MAGNSFTHVKGDNTPTMVDVGNKEITKRVATAEGTVILTKEIMAHFEGKDITTKKGPVFQTAIIAGIMAAKKTHELIPMCHPLLINKCDVQVEVVGDLEVRVTATVSVQGKTGVEMEALTAVSTAALTIYDMCKAFSQNLQITNIRLMEKTGGKTDFQRDS